MTVYKLGVPLRGISSDKYHKYPNSFSSTQLKTLAESRELFFKKYIEKSIPREESDAFDIGTYFHTAILEPEKLEKECIVFKDGFRRGPKWEAFKAKHTGKAIITLADHEKAMRMIDGVNGSDLTKSLLKNGHSEVSLFIQAHIGDNEIYLGSGPYFKYGFVGVGEQVKSIPKGLTSIVLKVRADRLTSKYVLDLKSSSSVSDNVSEMKTKVRAYGYDFSAAMYLDLFEAATGKKRDFIWVFACKATGVVRNFRAKRETISEGRAMFVQSLFNLRDGIDTGWDLSESVLEL